MNESVTTWLVKLRLELQNKSAHLPYFKPLTWTVGKRYIRVTNEGGVYCFLDFEGNIYKPAGWSRPAKHIRGTIQTINPADCDLYGSWLYWGG